MRHFADRLRAEGFRVQYTSLDDPENAGTIRGEVERQLAVGVFNRVIVTHPGEYRLLDDMLQWSSALGVPVEIRSDDRFLCTLTEFEDWAKGRKQLRMENFYRGMRKKYHLLMDGDEPVGGQWNYDSENRKPPRKGLHIPEPYEATPDDRTLGVISLVKEHFKDHFGDLEPFHFAVTREEALTVLKRFLEQRLAHFGDYQDAMIQGEPWMYHAHISFYLNTGLLEPLECVKAAEQAWRAGDAPLSAVEGFIRQIIGWREYVRGIYWLRMPDYPTANFFGAQRKLPDFYWTADTKMNCIRQCVLETRQHAYAHHIQRLMVLGNFALLAGIAPHEVNEWFLSVYADAFEWVEMPNVTGMILFADGGFLGSKPYAASGNYINRMSDYCSRCTYKVTKKTGSDACPFNYLYWDFMERNRDILESNHRLKMVYRTYDRMDAGRKRSIREDSKKFLTEVDPLISRRS
jgi:deoxyribodipyrimidine photolyase-related protein